MSKRAAMMGSVAQQIQLPPLSTSIHITPQGDSGIGHPVTFGLPIALDAFTDNGSLIAKIGGVSLPIQVDRKTYHSKESALEYSRKDQGDAALRSVAHVIVSTQLPSALTGGSVQIDMEAVQIAEVSTTPIAWSPMTLEASIDIDSAIWLADLTGVALSEYDAPIKAGTGSDRVQEWLSGNLCREWIVRAPFINNSSEHAHLTARFHIRRYANGNTRADVVIENNWSYIPGVASFDYTVQLKINNKLRYSDTMSHFTHARWHVPIWDTLIADNHVAYDPAYLMATQFVPNYDPTLIGNMAESVKTDMDARWSEAAPIITSDVISYPKRNYYYTGADSSFYANEGDPGAYTVTVPYMGPMGVGPYQATYMPGTGGRLEIGPLPDWAATWVLEQQYSAYKIVTGIGGCAGSWPSHYRDEVTDLPVSIEDRPLARVYGSSSAAAGYFEQTAQGIDSLRPYRPDDAHTPSLAYLPYMITGDYYHMEEMQFWATFGLCSNASDYRGGGRGLLLRSQLRAQAWQLRNIMHAGALTPDTHTLKNHYLRVLDNNRAVYDLIYLSDPTKTNNYGAALGYELLVNKPWMDDFLTWSVTHAVELGFLSWTPFAKWKAKYPIARMGYGAGAGQYCWILGAAYKLRIEPYDDQIMTDEVVLIETAATTTSSRIRPMFKEIGSVLAESNNATSSSATEQSGYFSYTGACNSPTQATELGTIADEIHALSTVVYGNVAVMQPAISAAAMLGISDADLALARYNSRSEKADYTLGAYYALVPRASLRKGSDSFNTNLLAPAA